MEKLKNSTILYIEDDDITRENISLYLKRKCKTFYCAANGKEGLEFFEKYNPDIIITDIQMPKLNGIDMAKKIRKISSKVQIIITTAYTSNEYLLEAVNLHLVKYIVKPISLNKLNDALQQCEDFLEDEIITKRHFDIDTFYDIYTKELIKKDEIIPLSKNERRLLDLLIKNYPASCTYEIIESTVYEYEGSKNAIKLLVKSLRNKINKETISNVSGLGYKINILEA